ncbi:KIS family RaS-RiPP peptide [Streptococcus suis]|uniref:KIS family RaS-RiPP peptide n=1 Tax=Streptococcus suis TaxID=1307 RepID=UPI00137ADAE6|nr:hypothetical protein [Streptococcus suis]HEM6072139.1 hypothetical protein [Streptococcus suis]
MLIENNVTYATPLLNKGIVLPIYACKQGTCNGQSHNTCSTEVDKPSELIMLKKIS